MENNMSYEGLCPLQHQMCDKEIKPNQDQGTDSNPTNNSCNTSEFLKRNCEFSDEVILDAESRYKRRRVIKDHHEQRRDYDSESESGCHVVSSSSSTENLSTDFESEDDDDSDNDFDSECSDDDEIEFEDFVVVFGKLRDCIKSYKTERRLLRCEHEQTTRLLNVSITPLNNLLIKSADASLSDIRPDDGDQSFLKLCGKDGNTKWTDQLLHTYGYVI
jgi:hypothetical protein